MAKTLSTLYVSLFAGSMTFDLHPHIAKNGLNLSQDAPMTEVW